MNEFGTPRLEAYVPRGAKKTGREEVEEVLRDLPMDTDTRAELDVVRKAMESITDPTSPELRALQVRRAALLEFERGRELPRMKPEQELMMHRIFQSLSVSIQFLAPRFRKNLQTRPMCTIQTIMTGRRFLSFDRVQMIKTYRVGTTIRLRQQNKPEERPRSRSFGFTIMPF